jgi:hypothetical protein
MSNSYTIIIAKSYEKGNLLDLDLDGMITLRLMLEEYGMEL